MRGQPMETEAYQTNLSAMCHEAVKHGGIKVPFKCTKYLMKEDSR